MEDVKPQAEATDVASVETETTAPESQQGEQTTEVQEQKPAVQEAQERMVPISVVQKERKERQELQRKLAEFEQRTKLSQFSEEDMGTVMNHPFVQELLIKQATSELKEYAKELLDGHPELPEQVKKAIIVNPRGFVRESTTDVESAKVDLQEYIDSLGLAVAQVQQPKTFPVASTTPKETASTARPIDVQTILDKPVDEWTEDEAKTVDQYKKTMPKR